MRSGLGFLLAGQFCLSCDQCHLLGRLALCLLFGLGKARCFLAGIHFDSRLGLTGKNFFLGGQLCRQTLVDVRGEGIDLARIQFAIAQQTLHRRVEVIHAGSCQFKIRSEAPDQFSMTAAGRLEDDDLWVGPLQH